MTHLVHFIISITTLIAKTTNTTIAAKLNDHVAAALAGQPTSIISVVKPNLDTICCANGPTTDTN